MLVASVCPSTYVDEPCRELYTSGLSGAWHTRFDNFPQNVRGNRNVAWVARGAFDFPGERRRVCWMFLFNILPPHIEGTCPSEQAAMLKHLQRGKEVITLYRR